MTAPVDYIHARCSCSVELREIRGGGGIKVEFFHCSGCCAIVPVREVVKIERQLPLFAPGLELVAVKV